MIVWTLILASCTKSMQFSMTNLPLITKEKYDSELTFISSNFPGRSQKIKKLFLNDIFKVVLLLDAILLFSNAVT